MFKNLLKIFGAGSIVLSGVNLNVSIINQNSELTNEKLNIYKNYQENLSPTDTNTWQSFITEGSSNLMFNGRVLKYYLANMVEYSADDMKTIENLFSKFDLFKNQNTLGLLIQNMIASTINISLYGASSDAEFYAEAFSKWMLTPDEQKNKSWEILNNFFLYVLPEIHSNAKGSLSNNRNAIVQLISDVFEQNGSTWAKYNLTLSEKPLNSVNLRYETDNIGWKSDAYSNQLINSLLAPFGARFDWNGFRTFQLELDAILNQWMNDSFTQASQKSIDEFNSENTNHFQDFDTLDAKLAAATRDSRGTSQIDLNNSLSAIEAEYLENQPTKSIESDFLDWTKETTLEFQDTLLTMYNYLYYLTGFNEEQTLNLSSALIFAADTTLVDYGDSTMGVTVTSSLVDGTTTVDSYVIILGLALTFAEFNSQYTQGFWSSPEPFAVVIHEFGHVLDGYSSRTDYYRRQNFAATQRISDRYSGLIFGYSHSEGSELYRFFTIAFIVTAVGILIGLGVTMIVVLSKKRSKK